MPIYIICSELLVIRKMSIETTIKYWYTTIQCLKLSSLNISSIGEVVQPPKLFNTADGNIK
jgi:hypothetical protein